VVGLLLFTSADVVYALEDPAGAWAAGTPLDATWTVAVGCVAVWVVGAGRTQPLEEASGRARRMLPVPAVAVVAGLAVLLVATQVRLPVLALVLAGSTIALAAIPVLLRQANLARSLAEREQMLERLVAVDKAKDDMIATVNHEMRTPLTSLSGYLELVIDEEGGPIPPAAQQMLRVAQDGATRLSALVSDMMTSTRLEAGSAGPSAPVRVDELLEQLVEQLGPAADARGVGMELEAPEPVAVDGVHDQLARAFSNVLENAVKFTAGPGSVRILVRRGTAKRRPVVLVSVVDSGMGIPAGDIPSVFDRFFRASNARTAAIPGSGLGLAIARSLVEAHGGGISAESEEGNGTTIRITLPLTTAVDPAPARSTSR
jgi:signal transduction histidine kinase